MMIENGIAHKHTQTHILKSAHCLAKLAHSEAPPTAILTGSAYCDDDRLPNRGSPSSRLPP